MAGLYLLVVSGFGRSSFFVDHLLKVLVLYVIIESLSHAGYAIGRLAGYDVILIIDFAILSRSPADFWQRYNRMVGAWLARNVFIPCGGKAKKIRAVLLTFLVSGIIHEYLFDIAISEVNGYQMAFFLVQALGVMSSGLLERLSNRQAAGDILARLVTIAFVLLSSILFFTCFDKMCPWFYTAESWLP